MKSVSTRRRVECRLCAIGVRRARWAPRGRSAEPEHAGPVTRETHATLSGAQTDRQERPLFAHDHILGVLAFPHFRALAFSDLPNMEGLATPTEQLSKPKREVALIHAEPVVPGCSSIVTRGTCRAAGGGVSRDRHRHHWRRHVDRSKAKGLRADIRHEASGRREGK